MCDWVTLLYRRKLTEHCKQVIMEKKSLKKETFLYIKRRKRTLSIKQNMIKHGRKVTN